MDAEITGDAASGYALSGRLTYATVPALYDRAELEFADTTSLDLGNVERIDSAGLALLMEWTCAAKGQHKELVLTNIPESLKSMIDVGGLEDVFSMPRNPSG